MNDTMYYFDEPHITGGKARVLITEEQIISYTRKHINQLYYDSEVDAEFTDAELILNFVTTHNALKA